MIIATKSSLDYNNKDDIYNRNALVNCGSVKFSELFFIFYYIHIYISHLQYAYYLIINGYNRSAFYLAFYNNW